MNTELILVPRALRKYVQLRTYDTNKKITNRKKSNHKIKIGRPAGQRKISEMRKLQLL